MKEAKCQWPGCDEMAVLEGGTWECPQMHCINEPTVEEKVEKYAFEAGFTRGAGTFWGATSAYDKWVKDGRPEE